MPHWETRRHNHPVTLSLHWVYQSLFYPNNANLLARKWQVSILKSSVWFGQRSNLQSPNRPISQNHRWTLYSSDLYSEHEGSECSVVVDWRSKNWHNWWASSAVIISAFLLAASDVTMLTPARAQRRACTPNDGFYVLATWEQLGLKARWHDEVNYIFLNQELCDGVKGPMACVWKDMGVEWPNERLPDCTSVPLKPAMVSVIAVISWVANRMPIEDLQSAGLSAIANWRGMYSSLIEGMEDVGPLITHLFVRGRK